MKKILFGLIGLVMITATVAGGAVALFSSQATLENVSFASGNATLQIWDDDSYEATWNSTIDLANMYPGYVSPVQEMWLKNASTAPINLGVVMALTTGGSGWGTLLKDVIEMRVADSLDNTVVGWKSLNDWFTNPASLGSITPDSETLYNLYFRMSDTADNTAANLSMPGVGFTLTGTQE